jgi:hypothetical protein
MRSRTVVRIQIALLIALVVLVIGRALRGPSVPEALVAWMEVGAGEVEAAALRVEAPSRLAFEVVGSYEARDSDELAAYAWMLDAEDRRVVWTMEGAAERGRGTLAEAVDTVSVQRGTYVVYFATHGARIAAGRGNSVLERLFNPDVSWPGDASSWKVVVQEVEGESVRRLRQVPEAPAFSEGTVLWRSQDHRRGGGAFAFEVSERAEIGLRAVGEGDTSTRRMHDYAQIDDLVTGEPVWTMTWTQTEAAGGSPANRVFSGTISLDPGLYRARFVADGSHDDARWSVNPPYDPAAWGATLFVPASSDAAGHVAPFAVWNTRPLLADLTGLGDGVEMHADVTVEQPARVAIAALGEMSTGGQLYDYAWLEDADGNTVWEMSREASAPAGGAAKNRSEIAVLDLAPGTYTFHVRTDGSHSVAGSFNSEAPDHPERWGAALFALDEAAAQHVSAEVAERGEWDAAQAEMEQRLEDADGEDGWSAAAPAPPPPPAVAPNAPLPPGVLARMTALGNNVKREQTFTLGEPTRVQVTAVGEFTGNNAYDFGLIRDARGEVVWEMTRANTVPGGGHERNRRYDGFVDLPAGTYTAEFRTDVSHAYGDFDAEDAPLTPEAWGMVVRRAQ